jgi:hyperosmotically inducible periplasmic protein
MKDFLFLIGNKRKQMKIWKNTLVAVGCAGAILAMGCAGDSSSRSTGEMIDDTAIHAKVKAALMNDPVVSGTAINVDVDKGVVYLNGAVNGSVEKKKAEEIVRGVNGVRSVENKIVVRQ